MIKKVRFGLGLGLTAALLIACTSTRQPASVWVEPVPVLTADTASRIDLKVDICIPSQALAKRNRLVVVPQLMQRNQVLAELPPVAVDAAIYARKMHRKKHLYGFVDTLAHQTVVLKQRTDFRLPYRQLVTLPEACFGGRIVGVLSTDGCGECGVVDTVDMAYISATPSLLDPLPYLREHWLEPEFVIRPKVMHGKGEALLQFKINLYNIDMQLGRNASELQGMLASLEKIFQDSLATVTGVRIEGLASADGSYAYNTRLSANRAESAKRWLISQMHLNRSLSNRFRIGSRPEGWMPVLQAMKADCHPDTLQVAAILQRYADENDDVAERYIRRLSCWSDIKEKYLQKDRKVLYEYTYTLKSFTSDRELLLMYQLRPDAFNEEEFLRVSTLKTTSEEKKEVYRTLLTYFPESETAANNLALLMLRDGKSAEALSLLRALPTLTPALEQTLALVHIHLGNYRQAVALLEPYSARQDARYHLGLAKAMLHQWKEAYQLLYEVHDVPAALVSLCVNDVHHASQQMELCADVSPMAAYVRAVVHARLRNQSACLAALREAVSDEKLRQRALDDVEFKDYWQDKSFGEIVKGGMRE